MHKSIIYYYLVIICCIVHHSLNNFFLLFDKYFVVNYINLFFLLVFFMNNFAETFKIETISRSSQNIIMDLITKIWSGYSFTSLQRYGMSK
jgi:thiaminase